MKKNIVVLAILLISTMAISIFAIMPSTNAHDPPWNVPTYAYINVSPDPVGVDQQLTIVVWLDKSIQGASLTNDIRFHNYQLVITNPDGVTETKKWDIVWDSTSSAYTTYTPTQTGTYTFNFTYPGQTYEWSGDYNNDIYLASTKSVNVTVQKEPLPDPITNYPLPTEYWIRPIEGRNTDWYSISSNWLGIGSPLIVGNFQPDGIAPNSSHIVWTKPIQNGGVVGGSNVGVDGNVFFTGMSYNQRFTNPIVMYGRLYYREPFGLSGSGGPMVCVDLATGETLWSRTDIPTIAFGYYYDADTPNQHGVFYEGILFTANFARAFDARTGDPLFNVTGVPSGASMLGPKGEQLRLTITNANTSSNPDWYLAQWNSSKLWDLNAMTPTIPNTVNANTPNRYDWNVSINSWRNGMTSPSIITAYVDDIMLGINGTLPSLTSQTPYTLWAVSLKPETRGQLLWMKTFTPPAGNVTILMRTESISKEARVFTLYEKETLNWYGYSLDTGNQVWGPVTNLRDFDYYSGSVATPNAGSHTAAYGNIYVSGYGGILSCINASTGIRTWTYGNGGEGNSTNVGLSAPWGHYPIFIGAIADGKVYLFTSEHSPNTPMYKDALIRCIDATNGTEIWTLPGWGTSGQFVASNGVVADGYYAYLNAYDMQIYNLGKGPSKLSVSIQNDVVQQGSSVMIKGSVIDISAGTEQNEQAKRFPNGVPAVSDSSMSGWMEYVYMQKPKPENTTGVLVNLYVLDSNNNFHQIGEAVSDENGFFSYGWEPDIAGKYTVYARFAGSESYWPSHAETAFLVSEPAATSEPPAPSQSMADLYFVPMSIGIILAVIVVGVLLAFLLLRKRP
jgi:outer membrane protein assembly factor BamB